MTIHYRTVWISDTHLGTKGCKAEYLRDFLNHVEQLRKHAGLQFNGVEIELNAIHKTHNGQLFLVMHGDEFDSIVNDNRFLAYIDSEAYEWLLVVNRWFNNLRKLLSYQNWSLSAFLKHKVKNIIQFMNNYQHVMSLEAHKHQVDGIICGHIHHADISIMESGKTYCNTGDWVESCTALVEDVAGELSLIHWLEDSYQLLDTEQEEAQSKLAKAA